jgi:hypothetical protein
MNKKFEVEALYGDEEDLLLKLIIERVIYNLI